MKTLTVIMLAMLMMSLSIGVISAEEEDIELVEAGTTPDSPLWGLDRAAESVKMAFILDKQRKAEYALEIAEERLAEIEVMVEENKTEKAEKAQEKHSKILSKAEEISDKIEMNGDEEKAEDDLVKARSIEVKLEEHSEKVEAVHSRILERQRERMSEEQIAHLEEVFGNIQNRVEMAHQKAEEKQELTKARYKALSGMSDEEIEDVLERRARGLQREKTDVTVDGDIELSEEVQTTLDSLVSSFKGVEGEFELELKITKDGNDITSEAEIEEGYLTEEQQNLWERLREQVELLVKSAEGEDLEVEIEIEHELEVETEDEEIESEDDEFEDENETKEDLENDSDEEDEDDEDENESEDDLENESSTSGQAKANNSIN